MTSGEPSSDMSERQAHAEATYERLFGPRDSSAPDNDPELMEILRRFIFGDVFDTGVLGDRIRELITVTVLARLQALPQLKSHTAAALHVGVQPIQIREAVYQLAPFVGFPRTLNAVATINEVFRDQGIELPLPAQGAVSDADRYLKGLASVGPWLVVSVASFLPRRRGVGCPNGGPFRRAPQRGRSPRCCPDEAGCARESGMAAVRDG
jgi:4-carboxymuconolactone decarboxylase